MRPTDPRREARSPHSVARVSRAGIRASHFPQNATRPKRHCARLPRARLKLRAGTCREPYSKYSLLYADRSDERHCPSSSRIISAKRAFRSARGAPCLRHVPPRQCGSIRIRAGLAPDPRASTCSHDLRTGEARRWTRRPVAGFLACRRLRKLRHRAGTGQQAHFRPKRTGRMGYPRIGSNRHRDRAGATRTSPGSRCERRGEAWRELTWRRSVRASRARGRSH
jgi:hypothetical protein